MWSSNPSLHVACPFTDKEFPVARTSIRETIGFVGVVASLAFVGTEIRQNNKLARANAYQEIGIATAQTWAEFGQDPDILQDLAERDDLSAISEWTETDWARRFTWWSTWLRFAETMLLQVEQGVLPEGAMQNLGYGSFEGWLGAYPGLTCLWPALRRGVGPALRGRIESGTPYEVDCADFAIPSSMNLI